MINELHNLTYYGRYTNVDDKFFVGEKKTTHTVFQANLSMSSNLSVCVDD